MTTISVKLPHYGAISDFYELRYICALHQTGREIRKDGSVDVEDVSLFLSSRYGIKNAATKEMLESFCLTKKVVVSHGKVDTAPHLQLAEIASMLFVPFLIKLRKILIPDDVSDIESQEIKPSPVSKEDRKFLDRKFLDTTIRFILWTVTQDNVNWADPHGESIPGGILTQHSMKSILQKFGLPHLAEDPKLVQEMVQCFGNGCCDQVTVDVNTFIKALTHDVLLFDVSRENEDTTNYYDVFHARRMVAPGSPVFKTPNKTVKKISDWSHKTSCLDSSIDEEAFCRIPELENNSCSTVSNNGNQTYSANTTKSWTFSSIDNYADTMRTKFLKFVLLLGFLAAINSRENFIDTWAEGVMKTCDDSDQNNPKNQAQKAICKVEFSILTYFVRGLVMGLVGWVYVGLGSLGNSVHERNVIPICISILVILGLTLYFLLTSEEDMMNEGLLKIPKQVEQLIHFALFSYSSDSKEGEEPIQFALFSYSSDFNSEGAGKEPTNYAVVIFYYLSAALGFVAILVQLISLLRILLLRNVGKQENYESILFQHPIVRAEAKSKRASSTKINLLVQNARKLYDLGEFINDPDTDVRRRGMKIFRTVLSENKTEMEHINVFWALKQVYTGNLLENKGIWISSRAFSAKYFQYAAMLWFFSWGLSLVSAVMRSAEVDAYNIKVSAIVGAIVGLLNMFFITSRYFPVYIATVLKLRSGFLQSLDSEEFQRYRTGIDNTWLILGFSFWGPVISSFMISLIVMVVIFCFMNEKLQSSAIFFASTLVGLWIALGIRVLLLSLFQKHAMGGFYRSSPASTNILGLFFECWNLFLALGYTTFRMVKIVCLSIFHAGRIDSPVLAKRASPVPFIGFLIDDTAPNFFIQDCLLHEAHRHPYIELLGKCYLYKLRYREQFMNRAGACWRLLFTLSLMPWLDSARFEDCYDVTEYEKAVASASTKNLQVEKQTVEQKEAHANRLLVEEQLVEQVAEEDFVIDAEIDVKGFNQQIRAPHLHVEKDPFKQLGEEDIIIDAGIGDQSFDKHIRASRLQEHPFELMAEEDIDLDAEIGDQGFDQNASPGVVPLIDASGMQKAKEIEEEMTVFLQDSFDSNDEKL